jgi:HK97 family phage major capsid protein
MMRAGLEDVELKDIQKFMMAKALGIGNDQLGGYLVEPVQAPEIIELLRPQVVVQRAGAQEMPLPPSGELAIPKQTGDVGAEWVGENTNIRTRITTNATFGQLVLKAKKLATFQILSNELVTSSTPAAEAIIRRAMAKKIAEKEDLTWLEGAGTSVVPMGIINHSTVTSYTASSIGSDGDIFYPQDVQLMIAEVEENDAVMEAWIMRPQMLGVIVTWRANQGTANTGEFMFDIVKDPTAKVPYLLGGYPVYTTTQVSGSRVKGSGTTLTYILAGMFSEAIIGRKATLEIKASAEAGTSFENDQVWLRGITRSDFGLRHPSAFVFCDQIKQSHS